MRHEALDYVYSRTLRLDRHDTLRTLNPSTAYPTALRLYRTLGVRILRLTAMPMAFCFAVLVFFVSLVLPSLFETRDASSLIIQAFEILGVGLIGMVVACPLFFFGLSYSQAITSILVVKHILGENIRDEEVHRQVNEKIWPLFWTTILCSWRAGWSFFVGLGMLIPPAFMSEADQASRVFSGLVAAIGVFVLMLSPLVGLISLMSVSLAPTAALLENLKPRPAVKRSKSLMQGRWVNRQMVFGSGQSSLTSAVLLMGGLALFAILGGYLTSGLLEKSGLLRFLVTGTFGNTLVNGFLGALPWFLCLWLITPIWNTVIGVVYIDRKIQWEGYDVTVLDADAHADSNRLRAGR